MLTLTLANAFGALSSYHKSVDAITLLGRIRAEFRSGVKPSMTSSSFQRKLVNLQRFVAAQHSNQPVPGGRVSRLPMRNIASRMPLLGHCNQVRELADEYAIVKDSKMLLNSWKQRQQRCRIIRQTREAIEAMHRSAANKLAALWEQIAPFQLKLTPTKQYQLFEPWTSADVRYLRRNTRSTRLTPGVQMLIATQKIPKYATRW